ncbi:MAG: TonB family protein [Pseudomonadota bacterium]
MKYLLVIISIFSLPFVAGAQTAAPDVTEVVSAYEAWKADPKDRKKRKAIKEALAAYTGEPAVETLNAHIGLLGYSLQNDRPGMLRETAIAAATHLEPVADIVPQQYGEAAYIAAAALFNDQQDPDAMLEMANIEGRMYALRTGEGDRPQFAEDLYWQAQAWRGAMDAYFTSADLEQKVDQESIQAILARWNATDDDINSRASKSGETSKRLPFCKGKLIQSPRMRYPGRASRKGMLGSLILRYNFDASGRITEPQVLASIPFDDFDERVKSTVVQWVWQPDNAESVGQTCRVERRNIVQQFIFALD